MASISSSPIHSGLSDDPDMMELVEEFVANLQDRIATIQACVDTHDLAQLTSIAHQLKGASGGYGFDVIGQAAAVLETSAKATDSLADVGDKVEELISLCRRATAEPEP